jgi:hypothetical protein
MGPRTDERMSAEITINEYANAIAFTLQWGARRKLRRLFQRLPALSHVLDHIAQE